MLFICLAGVQQSMLVIGGHIKVHKIRGKHLLASLFSLFQFQIDDYFLLLLTLHAFHYNTERFGNFSPKHLFSII